MSIFIEPSQRRPQHPGAPLHRARPQGAGGSHGRGFSKGGKFGWIPNNGSFDYVLKTSIDNSKWTRH